MVMIMTTMMILPRSGLRLLSSRTEGKTYLILLLKLKCQTNYFNDDGDDDDNNDDITAQPAEPSWKLH